MPPLTPPDPQGHKIPLGEAQAMTKRHRDGLPPGAARAHAFPRDVFEKLPEYAGPGVVAKVQPCTDLSFLRDGHLDAVFASNLLEHLTHEELLDTIGEVRRVLRPDGRLILLQPNFKYCYRTYFDDYTHLQVFTHMGIYDLLGMAGMDIEAMHARFLPVNMKSTLRLRVPFLKYIVRAYMRSPYKPKAGQMLVVARNRQPSGADASTVSRR